jgi:peptidoglycan lytic transglycosylase
MTRFWLLALGVLAIVIGACTTAPTPSRYPNAHDGAPAGTIASHEVKDAVPRADPILSVGNKSPYKVNGVTYEVLENHQGYRQQGIASWYGTKFNGHETSNGEIFDIYQASAAHKTLPIPCYARVTNLDNGNSIVVRVNDRGPFHSDRLIDLSYGAAVKLGYMEQGTARVEVEVLNVAGVDDRRGTSAGDYRYLQLGAFGSEVSAQRLQGELQAVLKEPIEISKVQAGPGLLYRVRVGPLAGNDELQAVQRELEAGGYEPGLPLP